MSITPGFPFVPVVSGRSRMVTTSHLPVGLKPMSAATPFPPEIDRLCVECRIAVSLPWLSNEKPLTLPLTPFST